MLSKKQVTNVCLASLGGNLACRYLADNFVSGSFCLKCSKLHKTAIDNQVNEAVRMCKKTNFPLDQTGLPIGDNCPGYPLLKNISQGYDVI